MLTQLSSDTICAISTPHGVGGIAVARVSGPDAIAICQKIWTGAPLQSAKSHTAHLGTVAGTDARPLDQCVATVFRAPASFTGDDVVEISVHGSRYVQQELINTLVLNGARMALPGEFTRRAFAAGKLDLAQAEAVADVIASQSRAAHRIAMSQMRGTFSSRLHTLRSQLLDLASLLELELDFSEEDVEFASRSQLLGIAREVQEEVRRLSDSFASASAIKDGIPVAIVGVTNAGKSSLLNALTGDDRAIVSDIHGTTRDVIEDTITIGDYSFRLMDTAGLRSTTDTIEQLGIQRSLDAARRAAVVIMVVDSTAPELPELPETQAELILAVSKSDLPAAPGLDKVLAHPAIAGASVVHTSASAPRGVEPLRRALEDFGRRCEGSSSSVLVANARHYQALLRAHESITRAIEAIDAGLSGDLISLDLRDTISHLGEILGDISSQDVLNNIFSRFCIGK